MPTRHGVQKVGVISTVLLASTSAQAALIEYTSRTAFNPATTVRSVEPLRRRQTVFISWAAYTTTASSIPTMPT